MATISGKRPFWMHQIAEYVVAAVFIAQGLQARTPGVPAVLGGLVLLNAACAKAPAAAFRIFSKRQHKYLDLVLVALIVLAAVLPVFDLDSSTRVVMGVLAFVLMFVWLGSDFNESVKREMPAAVKTGLKVAGTVRNTLTRPSAAPRGTTSATRTTAPVDAAPTTAAGGDRVDQVGRVAGRLAGKGVKALRDRRGRRS